jgi:peptidoglycan hydrolase CwlO-like protein
MEQIENLLSKLQELLDERDEKQEMLDEETEAGNGHEADGHAQDLADLNANIDAIKANVERQIRAL